MGSPLWQWKGAEEEAVTTGMPLPMLAPVGNLTALI